MKVLVVEDEQTTADYLRKGLSEEGYTVDVAASAGAADEAVHVNLYDLILLDVMLPGASGWTLCKRWREQGITTPILLLTARDTVEDRVTGLDLGADDYLVKPFAFEELLARMRALLRRPHDIGGEAVLRAGKLVIDLKKRRVTRDDDVIPLTAREFGILELLARRRDEVVTRTALWEQVWETGSEPNSNVVDVYVRYLRNKLGRDRGLIETVRGVGYMLRSEEDA